MVNAIICALIFMNWAESENLSAPIANKKEHVHNDHGIPREDPYFWLKNREDPQVTKYLEDENKYTNLILEKTKNCRRIYLRKL